MLTPKKKKSFEEQEKEKGEEIWAEQGSKVQVTMSLSKGVFPIDNHMK